jgi:hypothetical protein
MDAPDRMGTRAVCPQRLPHSPAPALPADMRVFWRRQMNNLERPMIDALLADHPGRAEEQ